MILSEQSALVSCPALLVSLAFALGLAALAVAAHNVEQPLRGVEARCEPVSELQQVIWYRQQSAAVEIDSLIGLVRQFRTIADELAGKAEDGLPRRRSGRSGSTRLGPLVEAQRAWAGSRARLPF